MQNVRITTAVKWSAPPAGSGEAQQSLGADTADSTDSSEITPAFDLALSQGSFQGRAVIPTHEPTGKSSAALTLAHSRKPASGNDRFHVVRITAADPIWSLDQLCGEDQHGMIS